MPGLITDGMLETARVLSRRAPLPVYQEPASSTRLPVLTAPLEELPFHEQVRLLIETKWTEYDIPIENWFGAARCWKGLDRARNRPLYVACYPDGVEPDLDHLRLIISAATNSEPLLIIISSPQIAPTDSRVTAINNIDVLSYSFDALVNIVADFTEYKRAIIAEFTRKPLPDVTFSISAIIAPTRVSIVHNDRSSQNFDGSETLTDFEAIVHEWLHEQTGRQLALLGGYGQGKSTAALALTYRILTNSAPFDRSSDRIPLLIRLTGRSPSTARLGELLGAWGSQYNLNGRALLALHRAGQLLLIFDAFDEMANVMDRTARLEHFDALWQFASKNCKLIFTGRPNFFLDDRELKDVLGISRSRAVGPYCEALEIAPFDLDQIELAAGWLASTKLSSLLKAVEQSAELREVCCRPSLLYLIAYLWNVDRISLNEDVKSAPVILQFVAYTIERQMEKQREEVTRRPERLFMNLSASEFDFFNSGLAVAALTDGRQNSLPQDLFRQRVGALFEFLNRGGFLPSGRDEVGVLAAPVSQRFADVSDPVEACANAIRTHGVIELDVSRSGHYRFSHKSFAEALAAKTLRSSLVDNDDSAAFIEMANEIQLMELADQTQVADFLVDLVAADEDRKERFSYVDLFNRAFPSRFDWWPANFCRLFVIDLLH